MRCGQHTNGGGECEQCKKKGQLQRKLAVGASNDPLEHEADRIANQVLAAPAHPVVAGAPLRIQRFAGQSAGQMETAPASVDRVLAEPGRPLDPALQQDMGQRFGHDFSQVRVHTGGAAEQSARDVNALAFTVGHNVVFGAGRFAPYATEGNRLLVHELAHFLQQGSRGMLSDTRVQRYEAGEHAQLGETESQLKSLAIPNYLAYTVEKNSETLQEIASKFVASVEELKEANKEGVHKETRDKATIEVFKKGAIVLIPPKVNPAVKDALKSSGQIIVTVKGVKLEYGDIIAMSGDMFEDVNDLLLMSPAQIEEIARLIKEEKTTGKALKTERFEKATGERFIKYAEKNERHFAQSNAALVKPSGVASAGDHKSEWEKIHKMALSLAQQGKKEEALLQAAFGDHYLTDAFAAGHLFNKRDVMEQLRSQLPMTGKITKEKDGKEKDEREFTPEGAGFFDAVAKEAWTDSGVETEFKKYEFVETRAGIHFNVNSSGRLSILLQGIAKKKPDLLGGAVAKAAHDELNTLPNGLEVQNSRGDKWLLSGDNTLNSQTKLIAKAAVAQSQLNVLSSMNVPGSLDIPGLLKKVWDYTPVPTTPSIKVIQDTVNSYTDPKNTKLINALAALIKKEHKVIIQGAVNEKALQKT